MTQLKTTGIRQVKDNFERPMRSLRISVTDHCNLNCWYCRAEEEICSLQHNDILRYEEITELVKIFSNLGVKKVRLTGGEPLLRPDIEELVRMLKKVEGLDEVTLTTNGVLLAEKIDALADAGLDRINMSLDTFKQDKFQKLTGHNSLSKILKGLNKLLDTPNLHPVKINTVAMRNFNENELCDFVSWAKETEQTIRFIEFMPMERGLRWRKENLLLMPEIKENIEEKFKLSPLNNGKFDTDKKYHIDCSEGVVGFISSISEPFCENCDRIRMTADGKIMNCLFSYKGADIKRMLRAGKKDQVRQQIIETYNNKWEGGCLRLQKGNYQPKKQSRTMSHIGG